MSQSERQQSELTTLHAFDNQDDSMLEAIHTMSIENDFDYLQECISSLESKDSGINLSPSSVSASTADLQLNSLEDDSIDMDFTKIDSTFLENNDPPGDQIKPSIVRKSLDILENEIRNDLNTADSTEIDDELINIEDSKMFSLADKIIADSDSNNCLNESTIQSSEEDYFTESPKKVLSGGSNGNDSADDVEADSGKTDDDKQVKVCDQCAMTFKYKRHLDRHLEGHEKNNCPHCNAKFARRKHLEVHLFRAHGERTKRDPFFCEVCSRSFPKRTLLNRHRAKHSYEEGKVCSHCGEMLKTEVEIREHEDRHSRNKFQCELCPQFFGSESVYQTHIQNHGNHKCNDCEATFSSKKSAQEHSRTHHAKKSEDETTVNGLYFCADCRHGFVKRDSYIRHLESAVHLSKVSKDPPSKGIYSCSVCSKEMTSQRALHQHTKRVHVDEKKFSCDMFGCKFQCSSRTDLDRHRQLHVEERNVVCEHCGKTFTSVSILNDHVLYVHNMERHFACKECGKAFKRNSLLNRHKLSHQQIRPFACVHCNAAFKRSHHLTRHIESCHRITLEKKKKVVKLMKTESGHLVPVPEKPRKFKTKWVKIRKESVQENPNQGVIENKELESINANPITKEIELSEINGNSRTKDDQLPGLSPSDESEVTNSNSQVLSLVEINSGQVVTVEVKSPVAMPMNDLVDQFEANCNEILGLSNYQDLEFHNEILNADESYYDQSDYGELPMENCIEETSLLLDSNEGKIDALPSIENYLAQPFPPFLNL